VREESGLIVEGMTLRGTISWPGFGKGGADWFGFIFVIDRWSGAAHQGNHEGTLEWHAVDRLLDLPMWESDCLFLPMVFDDEPSIFYGVMPYENGKMLSWNYWRG
jgi:8-oxo-dGTP diphosphatase